MPRGGTPRRDETRTKLIFGRGRFIIIADTSRVFARARGLAPSPIIRKCRGRY